MEARILKKVKRRAALCATCAAASLLAACSSTQEAAPEEPSYRSPYQSYRSLCVVPAEEHSASFDLTLARMLRDRGFEPELLETGDLPSVRRCRGIVTFSTGRTLRPFEAPAYTGETYHVAASRAKGGAGHALFADAPFPNPAQMIRQLVERLFPERTDHE